MSISKRILFVTFLSTLLITSTFAQGNNKNDGGEEEEEEEDDDGSATEEVKVVNAETGVTYDGRSLIINGKRELVFSGSIHYPRCPPENWEDLIVKSKRGGLNSIETYVFWNGHEPEKGKYNFEGDYNLVKFIKLIAKHKMFAIVRLGPFVQAEWNHGGLPYWLREVPGIIFRSDNEPFKITAQHNSRNMERSNVANKIEWKMFKEALPSQFQNKAYRLVEFYHLTKDTTDYAWYSTTVWDTVAKLRRTLCIRKMQILRLGKIPFISCYTVGLQDSGAYLERRYAGPRSITILGLNTGTVDISNIGWENLVGIDGEKKQIYTEKGSQSVQWVTPTGDKTPITWYKGYFDAPEGNNPVAIRMNNMSKGMVWINGRSIGRYWMSYLSALKVPTQSYYHIPRSYIKPTKNMIVIFEEEGGNPNDIEIVLVDRDTVCSLVSDKKYAITEVIQERKRYPTDKVE
ncbi:Beta-galactosidase 14 isoform 2 [Hibiscus syriacus]|uniref:beta-galactosidase n=1 Tax=Hibiscus syriacus TaxID=106335 RepID=A0A6A3BJX5_HIBSY|nr:Beta-galactosidase 14 isoform 2 [Hibiscus syriacus]